MTYNTRLIYVYDDYIGEEGWRIKRIPSMNVANARGLTHDILEHSRNDKGTWHEEISAFGALVAYRVNRSDLVYSGELTEESKIQGLAEELSYLINEAYIRNKYFIYKNPNNNACHTTHPYILLLAHETSKLIRAPDLFTKDLDLKYLVTWLCKWLNIGHKRAIKIIEKSGWEPASIWSIVHDQINNELFKSGIEFYEGHAVSVQIDFDRCWCKVIPINCKKLFQ